MKIQNTQARIIHLPPVGKDRVAPALIPGENELAPELWAEASENATVKSWIKSGWLKPEAVAAKPELKSKAKK